MAAQRTEKREGVSVGAQRRRGRKTAEKKRDEKKGYHVARSCQQSEVHHVAPSYVTPH